MNEKHEKGLENVARLRMQLVAVFSVLFAIAFAIISFASYHVSRAVIIRDIDIQTQEVVNGHAAEIDQWIGRMTSIISAYTHIIENEISEDGMITSKLLRSYRKESFFSDIYYGSAKGIFMSGSGWKPPSGFDHRNRPWYRSALNSKKPSVSELFIDRETGKPAVSISAPVYSSSGKIRGVLSADLQISTIDEKIKKIRVNGRGLPLLIDRNGIALVHPETSLIGKDLAYYPEYSGIIKKIMSQKNNVISYSSGSDSFAFFTSIPSAEWYLGVIFTGKEIYQDLKKLALKFLILFIISIIIVILTSRYFAGKLTYFTYLLEKTVEQKTSELKQKIEEVEYLSMTDHLTGIANRRRIESVLKSEIERSARTGSPLSVIMVDIDFFKKFNDTMGHETGDRILKKVAETLNDSIRGIDLAGRLGGEEFLIICPETAISGVKLVAEKLRNEVESIGGDEKNRVTASFGCAEFRGSDDWNNLIARADKALYRAKEMGRNRVESSP